MKFEIEDMPEIRVVGHELTDGLWKPVNNADYLVMVVGDCKVLIYGDSGRYEEAIGVLASTFVPYKGKVTIHG